MASPAPRATRPTRTRCRAFSLAIGLSIDPADLWPVLPAALAVAVGTAFTKVLTGAHAARRDGVDRRGWLRAGTALIARGEFSTVVVGLVGTAADLRLGALLAAYVLIYSGPDSHPVRRRPAPSPTGDPRARPAPNAAATVSAAEARSSA